MQLAEALPEESPHMWSGNAVVVTMYHQIVPGHHLAWQSLRHTHGHLNVSCFGWGSKSHMYREQIGGVLEERGSCLTCCQRQ